MASAIERQYQPTSMNCLHLGNGVPRLHVHLVPRFADDPRAGGPLEPEAFDAGNREPLDDGTFRARAAALRALIG